MRILIVEDEESLADLVALRLKKEKYSVDVSYDGEDGLYNALMDIYDLIILDIMLPDDESYSNIDLNGYKLYIGGKELVK